MKLRDRLVDQYKMQHELIRSNGEEVLNDNLRMLRQMVRITLLIFVFSLIISLLNLSFAGLRLGYGLTLGVGVVIFVIMRREGFKRYVLPGFYCIFLCLFLLTVYMSVIITPGQMGVSIIGLFCLMPMVLMDDSLRLNFVVTLFYISYIIIVWVMKSRDIAFDDTVNITCFYLIGILLGEYVRRIKLDNYEMKRLAKEQVDLDFLTGLYNRRRMYEEMKLTGGGNPVTGIIMLDIDYFKEYNDRLGHLDGDECLRRVGRFLKEEEEKQKLIFFRYGGEEFLAFIHGPSACSVYDAAEKVRQGIAGLQIPFPSSREGIVTVSAGCCDAGKNYGLINEQLIKKADQALYCAKKGGRNRTEEFSAEE